MNAASKQKFLNSNILKIARLKKANLALLKHLNILKNKNPEGVDIIVIHAKISTSKPRRWWHYYNKCLNQQIKTPKAVILL